LLLGADGRVSILITRTIWGRRVARGASDARRAHILLANAEVHTWNVRQKIRATRS
jgi:hypothetical protein